nr:hypothetical protein [Tanacetum cinerariifolium]
MSDDVLEETIAKDASEVVAEKERKKQKRKVVGDASGSTYPLKKLRDNHHPLLPNTGGKSLAALRSLVPDGSAIPSRSTEPLITAFVAPCWTLRFRNDDVLEETIAKDASEVVAEKERKKQKRKVVGDASGSTYPRKKLRDDHHPLLPNIGGKSLAALRSLVPDGSDIPSRATEPLIAAFVAPCWTLRFRVPAQLTNFSSPCEDQRAFDEDAASAPPSLDLKQVLQQPEELLMKRSSDGGSIGGAPKPKKMVDKMKVQVRKVKMASNPPTRCSFSSLTLKLKLKTG